MSILDKIKFPKDLKKLSISDLKVLNHELRTLTVNAASKTLGHLGARLGVFEFTNR